MAECNESKTLEAKCYCGSEGVMAEKWLTWRARLAWADSGKRFDSDFTEALQEGMNKWVLKREGLIEDYNIG